MKVICTQENLSHGLQVVSHIASKNISLPILNNVLLSAENGILKLATTNLEIGIISQIRGKIEGEGSFTVQAKTFSDYINLLPKENINMEVIEQDLKIECKKSKTTMKGIAATEFPIIPEVEAENSYEIKTQQLKEALASVVFTVALDETRPEISGVFFEFEGGSLTLAATDSYRLAERKVKLEKPAKDGYHAIVPLRTIQELIRILGGGNEIVTIASNDNQILFSLGDTRLTSRVIDGQYPDYKQIIPREHKTQITAVTSELITTIKQASLFCKQGSNDISLKFDEKGGEIIISATNIQIGESEARQEADIDGEDNNIVLNYRFLLDGLQSLEGEECIIEVTTNVSPGLLRPKENGDYLYIIMPIKQ
jgi:DNA polymerase III subunit beta